MKTDQEYEKLIKKEFGLSANSIWYRRQKWKLETNKEIYDELQKDVEVILICKKIL